LVLRFVPAVSRPWAGQTNQRGSNTGYGEFNMKKLVTVSQVVELVQHFNPYFTRESVYNAIDAGQLKGDRNPAAKKGHFKFCFEDVEKYTHETLGWPQYQALDLLRARR